jgi:alpha-tubulin suppressor-like RCC1 family protein
MGFSPLFKKWFRDDSILVPGESLANSGVSQLTHPAFRGVTVRGDDFATEKRGQSLTGPTLDGTVTCWGSDADDRCDAPWDTTFKQISAGEGHTCGIKSDGTLACWGADGSGQATVPEEVETEMFVQISAGWAHNCGIKADGTLYCWGANSSGQATVPEAEETGTFRQVSAGFLHTCAIRSDNSLVCWGYNGYGQAPDDIDGVFVQVSTGEKHTCGLTIDGELVCWGDDYYGQSSPYYDTYTQVSAGGEFTCAVETDGDISCWGRDNYDQIYPTDTSAPYNFSRVSAGSLKTYALLADGTAAGWGYNVFLPGGTFSQINAESDTACAIGTDGTLTCWGNNDYGKANPPAGEFTQVFVGLNHVCAIASDGTASCWGRNDQGQAGPPAGETFSQLGLGWDFTCGIKSDGTLACWGANSFNVVSNAPAGTYTQIATTWCNVCVLATNGTVRCWGRGQQGESTPPSGTFTQISGAYATQCGIRSSGTLACWGDWTYYKTTVPAGTFRQINTGNDHICAIRSNGTLACWGRNVIGEAPRLSITPTSLPTVNINTAYSQTLTASDGAAPYTFQRVAGSLPSGITLSMGGLLHGTPTSGGTFAFTVRVRDSFTIPLEIEQTYTLKINRLPVASGQTVSTPEDTPRAITLVATDADGDPLSWTLGTPGHGTLSGTAPNLTYTPNANWFGTDTFTFQVNDGMTSSNTATVTVNVGAVNDAPVAPALGDIQFRVDKANAAVIPAFVDVDGDPLTYAAALDGGAALPAWLNFNGATRTFSGVPTEADMGDYVIRVTASDGDLSASTIFTLRVTDEYEIFLPLVLR